MIMNLFVYEMSVIKFGLFLRIWNLAHEKREQNARVYTGLILSNQNI